MIKDVHIRLGQNPDTEILAHFNFAMAHETEGRKLKFETVLAGVNNLLRNPEHGFYVVAEKDGEVIGSLLVTKEWSDWNNNWYWWIQSVFVQPEYRRQGIYARLYDFVKEKAISEENVCGLRLYMEKGNEKARIVYRRLGMVETSYRIFDEKIDR